MSKMTAWSSLARDAL